MRKLIKNVRVITPYEIIFEHALLIEEGIIKKIIPEDKINDEYYSEIIDGENNFLAPGFIDIHNHGNSGYDFMDATEGAIDEMTKFHFKNGVISTLGTIITSSDENIEKAIVNLQEYKNKNDRAQVLGIHLEGPFFNLLKKGAQPKEYIKDPYLEGMKKYNELAKGSLKMVSLAPELKGADSLISYLKSENVMVAMAHSNATFNEAKKGVDNGVTIATHLYNGMRSFSHREPGIIGVSLTDERVYCELINDRIHLHDAATLMAIKMKGIDKIVLVSDAMRAAGLENGEYELGGQKVFVKEGAARLENGSLAGSTLNLRDAVYNMIKWLNIPTHQAVRMASLNPAKAIKIDDRKGSIEVGKDADLIIFDENINVEAGIVGGNITWLKN
ncbi:MAG TPA: N-acetylglucosamine-6-phosphate deacetylase [Tissierellales bacterium]|nr:N-acetylglucosamine-6-phosphate deacetylase [Tissierellales bacterium]